MRILFFIVVTLITNQCFGQSKTETINGQKINFNINFIKNENGDSIKQLSISNNNLKLLTHTLSQSEGDCNSEAIEVGSYSSTDSSIILYSYWDRRGDAPLAAVGARKQVYSVNKKGKLELSTSALYIETAKAGWAQNKGMKYLNTAAETAAEKKELKKYISDAEREYNATFVFGKAKTALLQEVGKKLKRQILIARKGWELLQ